MKIAVTGFVSEQAGSVAAANALLLRALLGRGHSVDFFSKSSFVDPRTAVGIHDSFHFHEVDNRLFDRVRRAVSGIPGLRQVAGILDAASYNRLLIKRIRQARQQQNYDVCLWMGDYARGCIPGLKSISFAQGAPGSDARSIYDRRELIKELAGKMCYLQWRILASLRLCPIGLPPFLHSDHIIIGSSVSKALLTELYHLPETKITSLPYPIDLELFKPTPQSTNQKPLITSAPLKILWLGRIVPRKRLELFLEAGARAIQKGVDLQLTVVGGVGFIPGYQSLIDVFQFPKRLKYIEQIPRDEVPTLLHQHDLLCQPSDEENFGSSVAEAQACGLPVIVGSTNGNSDYLCEQDIHLSNDKPETLASAFTEMTRRKTNGTLNDLNRSRQLAEQHFSLNQVVQRLEETLERTR